MGTLAQKLNYLAGTKTAIYDAIIAKGGSVDEDTPFRDYADAISDIPSAGDLYASITADWPDILSIVENDSDNEYPCKCLMLFENNIPELDFVKDAAVSKIKTSDSATYAADFIHAWNPLQDINGKYRYIILYMSTNSTFQRDSRCISIAYNSAFLNGVTNFSNMFFNCRSLQTIPLLDASNTTTFSSMFSTCYSLQTIPLLDTSNGTAFNSMFTNCYSLQTIPLLDTSEGFSFSSMFSNCFALQTIPLLDTSNGTAFNSMFSGCYSLQSVPLLDTSGGNNFSSMFSNCNSLQSVPLLDTSSGTGYSNMYSNCYDLQSIDASLSTSHVYNYSVDFKRCGYLSKDSILQIFANLPTKSGQTITIGVRTNAKLSDADRLIATNKGWALSVA